jgi:membrane associated rhomboid family serine protease
MLHRRPLQVPGHGRHVFPLKDDIPSRRRPIVTVGLMATCILVYWWQASLGAQAGAYAVYSYGFIPAVMFGEAELPAELAVLPPVATLVTSMFLHGGLMHLAGNMLYLWVFGNNIEDRMGWPVFLVFYLVAGAAAAYAQALANPSSTIPLIGASGAVAGTLGAYIVMFPHARVLALIPIFFIFQVTELSAWIVLGFWFVLQALQGVGSLGGDLGGVAWWAHIGGFTFGALIALLFYRRRQPARASPYDIT